jgi:predicted unusual protein kinase regulating ubiquinone biosynthesis (AarF/ABC1/UbiB family)
MKDHSTQLPNDISNLLENNQQPKKVWARRLAIFNFCFSFCLLLVWDWLTWRLKRNQQRRAKTLVQKLIQMGPTFIKFGQVLSCRPDLIAPAYVNELAKLQDNLPAFPNQEAYQVIAEELGCPYNKIYAELDPKPVATASLGQVYKGKLRTGETVAVKVQRPGIIEVLVLDIYLLQQLATWVQDNIPFIHTNIRALTDELANSIFQEMDYVREGANAKRFAELYGNMSEIYVPRIYQLYTTSRVLTIEWIDGKKITAVEEIRKQGLDPINLMCTEYKFALQQLLQGGFFHADPHPGNVLVTADGKLAYLDFGMMSEVKPDTRDLLIIFLLHLVGGDFPALAKDLIDLEFLPPGTDLVPLVPRLNEIFCDVRNSCISEFGFRQIFDNLLGLVYEYSWQIPKFYVLVFRSFATLEGIMLNINPEFQAYKVGFPYIAEWMLTQRSPVLWNALKDFCLKNETIQWEVVSDLLNNISQTDDFNVYLASRRMLEFLYSPQGDSFRHILINEVVSSVEKLPQQTFKEMMSLTATVVTPFPVMNKYWESIQPLLEKFVDTVPFNWMSSYELSQMFLQQEALRLRQEIFTELGSRQFRRFFSPN